MVVAAMALTSPCLPYQTSPQMQLTAPRVFVRGRVRRIGPVVCAEEQKSSGGGHVDPPKLEPFSQSRLSRSMRERTFLEKAENAINDKCMALDGEDAYQCWEALDDYENIKGEVESECSIAESGERQSACGPLERFESMVRQSGGVNSLIDNVRMLARMRETKKKNPPPAEDEWLKTVSEAGEEVDQPPERLSFLEDGGIPQKLEEMKDEAEELLESSPFTRFLRHLGGHHD